MRKAIAVLITLALVFTFVSCAKSESTTTTAATTTATASTTTTTAATTTTVATTTTTASVPAAKEKTYKLGMGVNFSDNGTSDQAAYDCVVATVVTDEDGVVVACKIDDAQNKMKIDAIDPSKTFKSKKELKYDYNMVNYSEAKYEWFEQVAAFEEYCVGKTEDEIKSTKTRVRGEDEPHPGYVVAADETLFASCSIQITEFIEAVCKAIEDTHAQSFTTSSTSFKLGLKLDSTAEETVAPTDEKDGTIKMYSAFGAAVVDEDGLILACLTDAIQPQYTVSADDEEIGKATYRGSKKELEFNYNMVNYSEAKYEWFEQAAAFEKYCVGKTADEVASLPTRVRGAEEAHPGYVVTADETLFASCSIQITEFKAVISEAAKNAN